MKYGLLRLVAACVRLFPLNFAYWLFLRLCDAAFFLNPRGRAAVRDNLRTVFAHQGIVPSQTLLDGCARKTFQYFGKYLADFVRYRRLTADGVRRHVSIQGLEHLQGIRESARGAILLTAHHGNWELGGAFVASMGIPVNAVVRPVESPTLERLFNFLRTERGMKVIPMAHAAVGVVKALRRGEAVALVGDRDFNGNGRTCSFFGRPASLPRGAAWFAHRTGAPLYLGFVTRTPDDGFLLRIHPPIDPAQAGGEEAIQARILAGMEEAIARDPCQWFIFDRFWPESASPAVPDRDVGQVMEAENGGSDRHGETARSER
jgi:lauroyl/myristoyl acyltransferase